MNRLSFLFSTLTLLVFVIVDAIADMESGIIGACIFAGLELMYTVYVYKKIDIITTVSVAFVILFGWFSFKFHDPIFFKIQPAIFSAILSLVFFVTQMLNKPLLILLSQKYSNLLPEQIRQNLTHPMMRRLLKKLSHYLCYGLFFNTLLLTYAALFMNNTMWIVTKSFGLIFIMGVCGVLAKKELQRGV